MLVGYMRVSTDSDRQVLDLQRDALLSAGVDERHLFEDWVSGSRGDRVGLAKALAWACRKLWRRAQDGLCPTPVSHFVNLWKTEAEREQLVLLPHRPGARKAEALAQPQHGFEALDGAPGRVEGLEAADPRHGSLDPEVVALDPLLQVLGDVMH